MSPGTNVVLVFTPGKGVDTPRRSEVRARAAGRQREQSIVASATTRGRAVRATLE